MKSKALIAMSGGVDSSVALYLMKQKNFECIGATMKLFHNETVCDNNKKTCCSLEDTEDARSVAYSLDTPYYVFNFSDDFKKEVILRFIQSYQKGYTPNPCIDCNRYMKFEKFYQRAKLLETDYVVTGHYAQIEYCEESKRYLLKKAVDASKDQSYVLYAMSQEQLAHTLLPLGGLHKSQVREIAQEQGFINAKKHDSQDICFVPDGDYASFIEQYTGDKSVEGNFIDSDGNILGKHKGTIRYTIGQRKGLGIAFKQPMYVCEINTLNNTVTLCESSQLLKSSLIASDFNWISCENISKPIRLKAKIRYSHKEQYATVTQISDNQVKIVFEQPQRAITSGQAVVLYDEDIVVGGGTIISVI